MSAGNTNSASDLLPGTDAAFICPAGNKRKCRDIDPPSQRLACKAMIKHRKGKTVWAHRAFFRRGVPVRRYCDSAVGIRHDKWKVGAGALSVRTRLRTAVRFCAGGGCGGYPGPRTRIAGSIVYLLALTGRIAHFIAPFSPGGLVLSVLFALLLAWQIVPVLWPPKMA